jgi:hypothetical protein
MVYKISLAGFFCQWTINPREYHPSSSQYPYTNMVYKISHHVRVEVLTTGRMILSWINSPPTEVTTQWYLINHVSVEVLTTVGMILSWIGGLLIPESIIRPVVSTSALTWFIRYHWVVTSLWINSPPTEVTTQWYLINHVSVEVLTTGRWYSRGLIVNQQK